MEKRFRSQFLMLRLISNHFSLFPFQVSKNQYHCDECGICRYKFLKLFFSLLVTLFNMLS